MFNNELEEKYIALLTFIYHSRHLYKSSESPSLNCENGQCNIKKKRIEGQKHNRVLNVMLQFCDR